MTVKTKTGVLILSLVGVTLGFLGGPLMPTREPRGSLREDLAKSGSADDSVRQWIRQTGGRGAPFTERTERAGAQVLLRSDSLVEILWPASDGRLRVIRFTPGVPESVTGLDVPEWAVPLFLPHPDP